MKTKNAIPFFRGLFLASAAAIFLTQALAAKEWPQIGSKAPSFAVKDQYDHETHLEDFKGRLILIVSGDRLGGDFMNDWAQAVRDNYKDSPDAVAIVRVANLRAVPPFFHAFVKHKFIGKRADGQPAKPVLLDWDGLVGDRYGFTDDLTNVYVVDSEGVLRYRASGKGVPAETQSLIRALNDIRQPSGASSIPERKQP
jgi:hypothetical protein